jgi:hypothetical protein
VGYLIIRTDDFNRSTPPDSGGLPYHAGHGPDLARAIAGLPPPGAGESLAAVVELLGALPLESLGLPLERAIREARGRSALRAAAEAAAAEVDEDGDAVPEPTPVVAVEPLTPDRVVQEAIDRQRAEGFYAELPDWL